MNLLKLIYGFWAICFAMLNLTQGKREDEMIKSLSASRFQTGIFIG